MAYGTAAGVAALTPRYANESGTFDNLTTRPPTLAHVTTWLTQISAMLDAALASYAVTVPVTNVTAVAMLDGFTNAQAARIVRGVNGQGKFAQELMTADEMIIAIGREARAWVTDNIGGIGALVGIVPDATDIVTVSIGSFNKRDSYSDYASEYTQEDTI